MQELEELNVSFCENLSDLRALEGLTGIRRIGLNYNPHLEDPECASENAGSWKNFMLQTVKTSPT